MEVPARPPMAERRCRPDLGPRWLTIGEAGNSSPAAPGTRLPGVRLHRRARLPQRPLLGRRGPLQRLRREEPGAARPQLLAPRDQQRVAPGDRALSAPRGAEPRGHRRAARLVRQWIGAPVWQGPRVAELRRDRQPSHPPRHRPLARGRDRRRPRPAVIIDRRLLKPQYTQPKIGNP